MSYQINKTDGSLLTDLIDGQIDVNSTNLVLVGRNYTGYGELFNENFVRLLENFSNSAAPSNPLEGQTWWDTADLRLKVFDGTVWKASGGPFVQDTRPQMVAGDLWIDNLNNQVYAYDGNDTILIGPQYSESERESGFRIGTLLDQQSRARTVAYLYIGGTLVGLFSSLDFTPVFSQKVNGLITTNNPNGTIFEGFNVINKETFKFRGIAESANALVTSGGTVRTADSFLPANATGITTGSLTIQNSGGLTIGLSQNNVQKIVGDKFYIENQLNDHDISLRVSSSAFGAITVDAVYVDASTARVGIFNNTPDYTLDVTGDLRITGDLIVEGDATSLDITTLRVEDKNIELGKTAAGTVLSGANADNAGLIVDITGTSSKTLTWKNVTDAWTSNVNVDISDNSKAYSINGVLKLTNTQLRNISSAPELTSLGTLTILNVDSLQLDGSTITAGASDRLNLTGTNGIGIAVAGDIAIQDSQKITGLADPTDDQDGATKIYADREIATSTVFFGFDISGLGSGQALEDAVASYLEDMYPPTTITAGKIAKLHTVSYDGGTVSGVDVETIKNLSSTLVDKNGTENQPVITNVTFDAAGASGTVALSPLRSLMTYESDGTNWIFQSIVPY